MGNKKTKVMDYLEKVNVGGRLIRTTYTCRHPWLRRLHIYTTV